MWNHYQGLNWLKYWEDYFWSIPLVIAIMEAIMMTTILKITLIKMKRESNKIKKRY